MDAFLTANVVQFVFRILCFCSSKRVCGIYQVDPDPEPRLTNDFVVTGVQMGSQTMGNTAVASFHAGETG